METPHAGTLSLHRSVAGQFLFNSGTGEAATLPRSRNWELSFNDAGFGILNGAVPAAEYLRLGLHSCLHEGRVRSFIKDHASGRVAWLEDEQKRHECGYELIRRPRASLPMKYFILLLVWDRRRVYLRLIPLMVHAACHNLPGQGGIRWVLNRWPAWEQLLLSMGLASSRLQKPSRSESRFKKPRGDDATDHRHNAVFDEYAITFAGCCVILCWRHNYNDGEARELAFSLLTDMLTHYFQDARRQGKLFLSSDWAEGCDSQDGLGRFHKNQTY